jgi:hypothetical protein
MKMESDFTECALDEPRIDWLSQPLDRNVGTLPDNLTRTPCDSLHHVLMRRMDVRKIHHPATQIMLVIICATVTLGNLSECRLDDFLSLMSHHNLFGLMLRHLVAMLTTRALAIPLTSLSTIRVSDGLGDSDDMTLNTTHRLTPNLFRSRLCARLVAG